ncbi:MAG: hypothetical protein QXI22_03545 [Sulfolobales archaeon]
MEKILLYNDRCSICYRMARIAWRITRGRIKILGMYSEEAGEYRSKILDILGGNEEIYSSMPWLIDSKKIRGGISILPPIILESLISVARPGSNAFLDPKPPGCEPRIENNDLVSRITYWLRTIYLMISQSYSSILTKRYIYRHSGKPKSRIGMQQ